MLSESQTLQKLDKQNDADPGRQNPGRKERQNMKRINGERYIVTTLDGNGGLITNPSDEVSVETCRAAIDRRNARASTPGTQEYTFGCKPQQFLIVRRKWVRTFDGDVFVKETDTKETVEIYPPKLHGEKGAAK